MSARTKDGLEDLESAIGKIVEGGDVDAEGAAWSANQRQAEALEQALGALERLERTVSDGTLPVDFWTIDLREAAMALGAVTGDDVGEDVLDVIGYSLQQSVVVTIISSSKQHTEATTTDS
jgi:tRNA modification GTPase